jgi:DNA-binding PadR family transcriptional regulator
MRALPVPGRNVFTDPDAPISPHRVPCRWLRAPRDGAAHLGIGTPAGSPLCQKQRWGERYDRVKCSAWHLLWWLVSVRHTLLALLSEGPKSGLQLREEFEASIGGVWPLNVGQLYAALSRLARDGLVEYDDTEAAGPHKEFRITAGGADELAAWLRTPPDLASALGQISAKVLAALRVPGTDVHEVVQVHRRSLMELMQQWTRIKQKKADHDLGSRLRIDAELFRLDSVIRWLDAADGGLMNTAVSSLRPAPPTLPRLQGVQRCPRSGRLIRRRAGQQMAASGFPTVTGSTLPPGCATPLPRAGSRDRNLTNGSARRSTLGLLVTCDASQTIFREFLTPGDRPAARRGGSLRQGFLSGSFIPLNDAGRDAPAGPSPRCPGPAPTPGRVAGQPLADPDRGSSDSRTIRTVSGNAVRRLGLRGRGLRLAAAPGVGRPATAWVDPARRPVSRDRTRTDRLQPSPHCRRDQT